MKTHHYAREETNTFDEVNKVFNELRGEIVEESQVIDNAITELSSRIAKLENRLDNPEIPVPKPEPLSTEAEDARLQAMADEYAVKTTKKAKAKPKKPKKKPSAKSKKK